MSSWAPWFGARGGILSVHVLGISGSMRGPSATRRAIEIALKGAQEAGAITDLIDVAEAGLPFCDGRLNEDTYPAPVQRFRAMVQNAQGLIIGSPEYHNGYTGALKNALDLCSSSDFEGKMVGLLGLGGGAIGAINALNQMRIVMRGMGAWVLPHQVSIAYSQDADPENDQLFRPQINDRLTKLGAEVAKFAKLMAAGIIDVRGIQEV